MTAAPFPFAETQLLTTIRCIFLCTHLQICVRDAFIAFFSADVNSQICAIALMRMDSLANFCD
jgi:hypothetical protein